MRSVLEVAAGHMGRTVAPGSVLGKEVVRPLRSAGYY